MNLHKILGDIRRADIDYGLIQDGDRIAVGVSGGKDSMVLLTALHMYSKFKDKSFTVVGIHIKMGFPGMNFDEISAFCEREGIEFHEIDSKIYDILDKNRDKEGRLRCSLCSKFKKAAVNQGAKTFNCSKVAFGHHSDDAVETLLMNAIYGGKLATFLPKMHLSRDEVEFIRPLVYSYEKDISQAIKRNNIPFVESGCPNDGYTKRQTMKELLNNLYDQFPMAQNNFLKMLYNQSQLELWQPETKPIEKPKKNPIEQLYSEEGLTLVKKGKHYFIVYIPEEYQLQRRHMQISEEDANKIIAKELTMKEIFLTYQQKELV